MKNNLEVVFFGTPVFAAPVLNELVDNGYNVVGIFAGSGPMELKANEYGIRLFKPVSLKKEEDVFEQFKILDPDICIVAAYGKIIPSRYLNVPKHGFVNVHPTILPKYRGPSPVQTAILNGDPALQQADAYGKTNHSLSDETGTETGVTIMLMDDQIDHGPILAQKIYNLQPTICNLHASQELFKLGAKLLVETLPEYISGKIKPEPQDHSRATFTKIFSRIDGQINWIEPAEKIYNKIRALNPEPGTWTTWKGKVINITTCLNSLSKNQGSSILISPPCDEKKMDEVVYPRVAAETPGTVKKIGGNIAVATGKYYLALDLIQLEGKKKTDAKSFINGHPDFVGSILE